MFVTQCIGVCAYGANQWRCPHGHGAIPWSRLLVQSFVSCWWPADLKRNLLGVGVVGYLGDGVFSCGGVASVVGWWLGVGGVGGWWRSSLYQNQCWLIEWHTQWPKRIKCVPGYFTESEWRLNAVIQLSKHWFGNGLLPVRHATIGYTRYDLL